MCGTLARIRQVLVGALVLSLLAMAGGGYALWRTFDVESNHATTPTTTVPAGPPLVTVPSELNKNGLTAVAELANLKLATKVTTAPSVSTRRNFVLNQDPLPGTVIPEGSTVALTLSSGPF